MAGRLVVLDRSGRAKSKSFALGSGMCTLGRGAACDIRVLLADVSPHHATVTVHANQTVVRNVGSGTTLVNGASVSVCALQHGDELDICGRKLRWEYDTPQAPKRNKTQPALALPTAPSRANRRGTLGAPPRAPDRDVQLALELRHRASMPANSGAGGKQVAIVQPQRRNTDNQYESASPRLVVSAAQAQASSPPAPAPRKSASARLHTPTKATLWIESRRGPTRARARAASLRTATPLRLTVLRKALTPAPPRQTSHVRVTKIQAPLHIDHTKRAAIMLMTGHTPKAKLPSPKTPTFVAKKQSPATRTPKGRSTLNASKAARSTPQLVVAETPSKSTRKSNTRNSGKQSVSVLETTDSSPALSLPNPPKSALKSGRSRKTESIKFDLSNLENHSDDDILMVSSTTRDVTEDVTLRYSSSPPSPSPSPSPRRSIHSRSGRMLESLGSPLRSPSTRTSAAASPASPRSLKSARGSIIVQKALESSDTFVTEYSNKTSPRRSNLEAYSVVDLISLDSDTSRSVYGSAGSPSFGSSTPYATRVPMDDTLTTPENAPRAPSQSTRKSRSNRSRSRLDDSTRTIDSIEDDSPKSSRKLVKSASKRSRSLNDHPESPRTYISLDSSPKSLGNISTTAKRGSRSQLNASDLLVSPTNISIESMKKSLSRVLSASKSSPRSQDNTLDSPKDISSSKSKTPTQRSSRGDATITLCFPLSASRSRSRVDESSFESPDITANSTRKSLGKTLTASKRGSQSQIENITLGTPENVSTKRKLPSPTKRTSRSLDNMTLRSPDVTVNSTRQSARKTPSPTKRGSRSQFNNSVPSESPKTNVLANSARKSAKKSPSPTKRSSRSQLDTSSPLESPKANVSARNTRKTPSPKLSSSTASPKSPILVNSSKKSLGKTLSATKRSSRSEVDILSTPNDLTNSISKSTGRSASNRGSRSKMIDSLLSPQLDALASSTRRSLGKSLSVSKRGSRSLAETILSSPETEALADSTRKSIGKTPKRGSRTQAESILSSPETNASTDSNRKSLPASKRGSRSKIIDSVLSPQLDALADSTRKSLGKSLSSTKRGSRGSSKLDASANSSGRSTVLTVSDSKRASRQADSPFSSPKALADSTRKSLGKTPKRGSRSQLDNITLESPKESPRKSQKANVTNSSTTKSLGALSTSKRSSRSKIIDSVLSPQLDALSDSKRRSIGKNLSTIQGSRSLVDSVTPKNASTRKSAGQSPSPSKRASQLNDSVPESPKDTSRKSRTQTLSTSSRRTRSLPLSPQASTSAKRSRISVASTSKQSPVVSPRGNASRISAKSPSNTPLSSPKSASPRKSPKSPAQSPAISPKSKSRNSRKTLTVSITSPRNVTVTDGEVTPEERGSLEDAGTPVLSIRSLLDATVSDSPGEPPRKRGRPSAVEKRKTFAALNAPRNARGSIRSKSLILVRDVGDVTPTGAAELTPEAVKSKHSSAKKSRSRRSIIDNLDDSSLVKHLFNSPVKRKLSQSMSEFSRRLEETEETSPNVSGVKRLFTKKSPRNELKDFNGVRRLLRTPRARRSIKNDLTDVAGVKVMFAAAPRDSFGDVRGIKRAFQGSPKNDLGRVSGVKDLFNRNKPCDDLSDVRGVRELFKRGPRNELNASGVKDGLQVKSPKNDLRDVRGVKQLFRQSKAQTSPNVSGVARLLDDPAPAEVLFDRLVGKPPVRATYSKTFVARSAKKPAKRRRTTSLSVPVDVLVNNVEGWLEEELKKRTKPVNRELQKLATDTVAGGTPILSSRSRISTAPRRSAAENYAAHTLPIKKRSLENASEPRSGTGRKKSLPLKKRTLVPVQSALVPVQSALVPVQSALVPVQSALVPVQSALVPVQSALVLVHSTPVKGRVSRAAADATLARMSPIALEPTVSLQSQGSPAVFRNSPKKPKLSVAPEPEKVEKNESVKPSPKKTRAKRAQEIAGTQRATRRGRKDSPKKKPTPKKAVAAKTAPATVEEPTKRAPVPKAPVAKPATPKKSPIPKKATRAKKVVTPKKVTPKKATRGKKAPTPSPKKSPTPKKATRAKKVLAPAKAATPKKSTPKKATRGKKVLTPKTASPTKSPIPKKATRSKKVVIPEKAATPKKTAANPTVVVKKPRVVVAASPKPTRDAKKAAKTPPKSPAMKQSRSKKGAVPKSSPKSPATKSRAKKQSPARLEKRGRKASPAKKVRVSLVLPRPSPLLKPQPAARARRSAKNDPKPSPKKLEKKNPAAGDAPVASEAGTPQKGRRGKASPKKAPSPQKTSPKRGRRAASPKKKEKAEKGKTAKATKGKTEGATPEPRRRRKAPATPEAEKVKTSPQAKAGRKAAARPKAPEPAVVKQPGPKKGRATAADDQVEQPPAQRGRRPGAAAATSVPPPPPPPRPAATTDTNTAPKEAAKSKGKKVTIVEPVQSPQRGRKRKNDSADNNKEPSPKKTRASRAAQTAAPARRRR